MIVPQNKLLFWFALVALPFSVLGAVYPNATLISLALVAALALIALTDAILASGVLDLISAQLPPVVRLSKDRRASLPMAICNPRRRTRRLRLGLALPPEIRSEPEEVLALLPPDSEFSQLTWSLLPAKRGHFSVRRAYLEASSPLGLWLVRASVPVECELRVYPNLLTERKNLAALFLHRGAFGLHAQRQVGKGRDFEKLREYIPGDSYDEIHWKATAKRGHPVTKVFQIERTQEIYVIIDASRLSARRAAPPRGATDSRPPAGTERSTGPPLVSAPSFEEGLGMNGGSTLERFITAALVLGLAAEQQGDLFGLLTFSDKVENFVRARNGQAHHHTCRDALYALEPRIVTPDFDEVAAFIRLRLRRRALLVFLTSLEDPVLAESFVRNMDLLCRQHLVLVNMMKPPGADPLFSHPDIASLDGLYQELGGHLQWHGLRELEKVLQRRGVRLALLENEKMSAQLVSQYMGVKQRQLL